ncbi:CTP synthase [Salinibacter sp. 10B]|uniref:CTP synthase n=1 Tax=Salinibacter sp. 10B TaxID=1923971 RepID=UPI000CF3A689|nr:CTP synthase [Salinibacter sp. 10B]PQJ35409.1 CTP synthase [Salinibacter sp. 10B]
MQTKYLFVTGGVTSSLGKGIFSASLGRLLAARGLDVSIQKFDPYINVDPGTMNPYEHGEVYVTNDGAETDLDLGHYERFLDQPTSQANNVTTGRVYMEVITKEREGAYLGKTVQVVPHIIDEIKHWMLKLGETGNYDVVITEIGGTVGDIEAQPYLEAIRQLRNDLGPHNTMISHLTLIPYLRAAGELKTKPTQHSVKEMLAHGLQPDSIVCRSEMPIDADVRRKISLFCNVEEEAVIEMLDAETIYEVPLLLKDEGMGEFVVDRFYPESGQDDTCRNDPELDDWIEFLKKLKNPEETIPIALVGKYVEHQDAYKSISESFILAGVPDEVQVDVKHVLSEDLAEGNVEAELGDVAGILVAPGFGDRGVQGKVLAAKYARENDVPFFGICLGLQCAIIEFARNVCGWEGAHSTEFDEETAYPVIDLMEEQKEISDKGGTMRLGQYDCEIQEGSRAHEIYADTMVQERHRHRYEVNNLLRYKLLEEGMRFTGVNPDTDLVEIMELPEKRWFLGVQFHPEYKTTVGHPHPLFRSFVRACRTYAHEKDLVETPQPPEREAVPLASADM